MWSQSYRASSELFFLSSDICVYICIHIYVYICIHIYTHTPHIYTHRNIALFPHDKTVLLSRQRKAALITSGCYPSIVSRSMDAEVWAHDWRFRILCGDQCSRHEVPVQHLCLTLLVSFSLTPVWLTRCNWNHFYTRLVQVRNLCWLTWPFQGASFCSLLGTWWCGWSCFITGFLSWRHHCWAEGSCCYWRRLSFLWYNWCSRAHLPTFDFFPWEPYRFRKGKEAHFVNCLLFFLFSFHNDAFLASSSSSFFFCRRGKEFRQLLQILKEKSCQPRHEQSVILLKSEISA